MWDHTSRTETEQETHAANRRPKTRRRAGEAAEGDDKDRNPIMRRILGSPLHGLVDEHLLLLHYRGRRTGRAYTVVAGQRVIGGQLGVLTNSGWRLNFRGGAPVGVTLKGELRRGRADLVENPEEVA